MPPHRSSARLRCEQCGSKRIRKDRNTGLLTCREGHVLQGYREEEVQDDGEFTQLGLRRHVRKERCKKRRVEKEVYKGPRATFMCYECLQLILRLQLKALRQEWPQLPPEVEVIARDLWAMYVSMLPNLEPTPYKENLDFVVEQLQSAREDSEGPSARRSRSQSQGRSQSQARSRAETEEQQEQEEEERRLEAEISRLEGREEPSEEPTAPQAESSTPDPTRVTASALKKIAADPMVVLVSIIYLALLAARVPVVWGDIRSLLASNRVPLLSAAMILPSAMTAKLPESQLKKIELETVPSVAALQLRTSQLAAQLRRFEPSLQFPEVNAGPVLWRCVQDMGLPPPFYGAALSLLTYLGIPLAAVPEGAVADPWSLLGAADVPEDHERIVPPLPTRLNLSISAPCASRCSILMGAVVLVAKLRYGLDGRTRREEGATASELSGAPPLAQWLEALTEAGRERESDPHYVHELATHPAALDGDQLDAMLDFAEEALLESNQPNLRAASRKEGLDRLFPNLPPPSIPRCIKPYDFIEEHGHGGHSTPATSSKWHRKPLLIVQREWRARLHSRLYGRSDGDASRDASAPPNAHAQRNFLLPGEGFHAYATADPDGAVHPSYERVLSHAALCIGLAPGGGDAEFGGEGWKEMLEVVCEMEQLLLRRMRREAKLTKSGAKGSAGAGAGAGADVELDTSSRAGAGADVVVPRGRDGA